MKSVATHFRWNRCSGQIIATAANMSWRSSGCLQSNDITNSSKLKKALDLSTELFYETTMYMLHCDRNKCLSLGIKIILIWQTSQLNTKFII